MSMLRMIRSLAACALTTVCLMASAADVYVVTHPGTTLTPDDVREVFLGGKQFAGSQKLSPVDNSAVQDEFLAKVMKSDAAKYGAAWTKKAFRDGLTAPPVKSSDAEVVEFVKRTPGGVGYVSTNPSGVNVVGKF